ncbi:MAG: hypothetical protein ACI92I_000537 [Acidimicrobiales bacterium]|jgi:hypothetical protein
MVLDKLNLLRIFSKPQQFNKNNPPLFPDFKLVEFSDKSDFNKFIQDFDTYSDFNFNSFFSWDTEHKHKLSQLNGNLILKFADYVTGEPFYSLIGTMDIDDTLEALLDLSEKQEFRPILKLIPEITVNAIKDTRAFTVEEDLDNFDYIFSLSELSELRGNRFKSKRRAAIRCATEDDIKIKDESDNLNITQSILEVSKKWEDSKKQNGKAVDMEREFIAIQRILENSTQQESLKITCARRGGELVGFSIDELLPKKYVLSHYFKTLPSVTGLSEYLNMQVAIELKAAGYEHWNWEQDLGIESLQKMKQSYRPKFRQSKFTVQKTQ